MILEKEVWYSWVKKTEADCSAKVIKRDYKKEKNTPTHKKAFKTQKMIDTQTEKKNATTKIYLKNICKLLSFSKKPI